MNGYALRNLELRRFEWHRRQSNLADALVNLLDHYRSADDIEYHAADAIIAALPGIVKDLVWWAKSSSPGLHAEGYNITGSGEGFGNWQVSFAGMDVGTYYDEDAAIETANRHRRAQIMVALGEAK